MNGTTRTVATVAFLGAIVALGACGGAGPLAARPSLPPGHQRRVAGRRVRQAAALFSAADRCRLVDGLHALHSHGHGRDARGPIPAKAGPRTFWVRVPADYDPNRAYRVVYLGQGCGGTQIANLITYPLFRASLGGAEQAIYVALDVPENMANADCYDDAAGLASQEWEA